MRLPSLLILIIFITGCDKASTPDSPDIVTISDLLPRANEISGWDRMSGNDAAWLATNASELLYHINGGAELYTNHGFIEATMQLYSGIVNTQSGIECEVQIYDQGTESFARAVYDDPNNVFVNPITPSNPPSAKSQIRKDIFSHSMKFVASRYYVLISITSADDKARDVLEMFALNIAGRIQ